MSLNPQQHAAVKTLDHPLLVLAGAGSGKTRVITQKIAYLIEQGISAQQIFAVTFTNKAAREMAERVRGLVDKKLANKVNISTFHRLGLRILTEEIAYTDLAPGFSIFDGNDVQTVLKDILFAQADADVIRAVQSRIGYWKNQGLFPHNITPSPDDALDQQAALAYGEYQRKLHAYNAVDFDDLLLKPLSLFQQNHDRLQVWRAKVGYMLVDEFQDTNGVQYALMKALVGNHHGLTLVGDDDQSIYAWRGANPENMRNLQQDFPRLQVVMLEQNYRSTNGILQAANGVISQNPQLFEKRLWSAMGQGDLVRVMACDDEQSEAERILQDIRLTMAQRRNHYGDYAIIYRSNHQSLLMEQELRREAVPYVVSGGQSYFERIEIKDALAYLRLITNPGDAAAFLRIVNVPRREIGPATLEKLSRYAADRQTPLLYAAMELGLASQLQERQKVMLQRFAQQMLHYVRTFEYLQGAEVLQRIKQLFNEVGYEDWLVSEAASVKQGEKRLEILQNFFSWIGRLLEKEEERNLSQLVQHFSLIDRLDNQDAKNQQNALQLMTIHAAKGLEFPHVYIMGAEEGILPHKNSLEQEEGIHEERRLMYVAITRAQRQLTLSYAKQRRAGGAQNPSEVSRFLYEIPSEVLSWPNKPGTKVAREETVAIAQSSLAALRSLLNQG